MKTNKLVYGLFGLLALASCSDKMDYSETVVKDKDYVIQTFEKVGGFMTDIYNYADYDYGQNFGGGMLASATDESVYSVSGTSIETFYNGSWSPSNAQGSLWSNMYKGIKTCNVVLKDFQDLKFEDFELNADYQQQMYRYENYKWEARFWRATSISISFASMVVCQSLILIWRQLMSTISLASHLMRCSSTSSMSVMP